MLSNKPIHLIESHEEEVVASILRSIHRHPEMAHLGSLPEQELREQGSEILRNLSHWLTHGHDDLLAHKYERVGQTRFEQAVPLEESVRGLCLLKEKMLEFLEEQGTGENYLALYAEEQFERRIGRFFDLLTVHLVHGYEKAWRLAAAGSPHSVLSASAR